MIVNELRPKDIFNQAIEILYSRLEPLGWRLLKNGDIKKKNGKFTYKIFFFRSSKNYIHYNTMNGSITTEIYCNIDIPQLEAIYQLRFARDFELLTKECELNIPLIESIWKIIDYEYISVIKRFEENPRQQLLKMGLMKERYAPDYSYKIILRKELLELFGFVDLLNLYNENNKFYDSPKNNAYISQESYFYTVKEGFDSKNCNKLNSEDLLCLAKDVYSFIKETKIYDEYIEAKYQHLQKLSQADKFKWVIAVFGFVYTNLMIHFKKEPSAKKILKRVLELYTKINKAYC